MKILVCLPNWLGDVVMATPSLETLYNHFPQANFTLLGTKAALELFAQDIRFPHCEEDISKKSTLRMFGLWKLAKQLGTFDLAITFRNSISSSFLLGCIKAIDKVGASNFARKFLFNQPILVNTSWHQVEIYHYIVSQYLGNSTCPIPQTSLHIQKPDIYKRPTVGLAPGASYGSAKRWHIQGFIEVAKQLAPQYDICILGDKKELAIGSTIANGLEAYGIRNFQNLMGQTSIIELLQKIAGLSLFITNDSGPMHIASAFQIPTVAIFGPTIPGQTSPWKHSLCEIVRKKTPCAPCMKRVCPYQHHNCMKSIHSEDVMLAIQKLSSKKNNISPVTP